MKSRFLTFAVLLLTVRLAITFTSCESDDSSTTTPSTTSQTPSPATGSSLLGKTFTKSTTTVGDFGEQTVENMSITFLPAPHCMVREWTSEEVINLNGTKTENVDDSRQMIAYYNQSGNTVTIKNLLLNTTFSETISGGGLQGYELTATDETIKNLPAETEVTSDMIGYYDRDHLRQPITEEANTLVSYGDARRDRWESVVNSYWDLGYRIVDGQNMYMVYSYASLTRPNENNAIVLASDTYTVQGMTYVIYYCMDTFSQQDSERSFTLHGNQLVCYRPQNADIEAGYSIMIYSDNSLIDTILDECHIYKKVK